MAMSGGVDSSVAAALLKKRGFSVRGVFIKTWSASLPCDQKQDRLDAMKVALQLKIPFQTWDFSREYKRDVVDYMVSGYAEGITPNPDIMCNKYIKFGLFLERALKEGADFIATGHYARIKREIRNPKSDHSPFPMGWVAQPFSKGCGEIRKLLIGKDKNKDQSYFLWTLTQKQLQHCLFPIGEYTKPEVRKLAKKFGLHTVAQKKDSQGICFLGKIDLRDFLEKRIGPKPGLILTVSGQKIGKHQGLSFYTIGQRKGIGLPGGPWFVAGKDLKKNVLVVTKSGKYLLKKELVAENVNWVGGEPPKFPLEIKVKVRYLAPSTPALVDKKTKNGYKIQLVSPQRAIAPGQSAVFYKSGELLGGGVIAV
ncbi:MAG: tRNA-specific 2-thiouridylase [Parcubacteria group bacterium Gr01-1014_30]|nr:MAG: tRNA-specific 2-thiouridylase [Parcubacteria group bacterium Gr01-1014_30]